ncbi:hypothetical protein [Cypionkella sp.]|uniref:tetratricopeptide repeat protein n=1 Tax=Cypionkella sp. TaxID=2811411 RepID=UPI002AB8F000|nr:hypothetical protein [Cypionkella sp.]MDZ4395110.1 hypothetical protein [Cypionkella sp.]
MTRAAALTSRPFLPLCFAVVLALPAFAQTEVLNTVAVNFEPPRIEVEKICAASISDEQLAAQWAAWDGKTLPEAAADLIQRDLRRLMDSDAIRWFDTIEKAQAMLPSVDPQFSADKALLARVELLIAAGRLKELTNQRLVDQLMANENGGSPRLQNILADYLMNGTGIPVNKEKGLQLLVAAGYGGNADALLKIVALQEKGTPVPGWDVPSDIAVTMAFGALVGKMDPMICDRVARIAREYMNGTIVTRDVGLAEKWFRFAADMGDGVSAWKVAEMHMRSEDLVKSNDTLITYMTKAADAGLPYAQVALGRLYEQGALVGKKDIDRARALYEQAAKFGDRAGLLRNALFLQAEAKVDGAYQPAYRAALEEFAKRPDAPAWIFIALGDFEIADKGRWDGESAAVRYYEKAEAMGEPSATKRLTPIRFRYATTPKQFYQVIDEVIATVHTGGEIDPMNGLKDAFSCRAPQAPQRTEAEYWEGISTATGTKTVEFTPTELLAMIANPNPQDIARLQSQALYGRPTAIAQYMEVLARGNAAPEELAFWESYAKRFDGVTAARGRLEHKFAEIGQNLTDPTTTLRAAIAEGDTSAQIDLVEILLKQDPQKNAAAALAAIEPMAEMGNGAALRMLPQLDPKRFPDLKAVYAKYADVIESRGDFDAVVLALPFQPDQGRRDDYLRRATTATDCSFDEIKTLADAMGQVGDQAAFTKWVDVAEFLSENDSWRLVQLGDLLRHYGGESMANAQLAYYERGYEGGNTTAIHRLLDIYGNASTPQFNAARTADLYVALVERSQPKDIPRALARLAVASQPVQDSAYARLDVPKLYRTAAEAGNPAGMREYGKLLQSTAQSTAELETSTLWISKAADAGDVPAMLAYADALAFGLGVPASRDQAMVWLQKASDAGNTDASAKVRSLMLQPAVSQ